MASDPTPRTSGTPLPGQNVDWSYEQIQRAKNDILAGLVILKTQRDLGWGFGVSADFRTLSAARASYKPFLIGFIPPDLQSLNFTPIERTSSKDASIVGKRQRSGGVVQPGISASSPNLGELQAKTVYVSQNAIGDEIYRSLINRGIPEQQARSLVPLMVGQVGAELAYDPAKGGFRTHSYNIGNVHAGSGGKLKDPNGSATDPSNWERPPSIPKGGTYVLGVDMEKGVRYPVYFQAAPDLQTGVDKWVGSVSRWTGVLDADDPHEYVQALRPDLNKPPAPGSDPRAYFTADPAQYERNLAAGANRYRNQVPNGPGGRNDTVAIDESSDSEPTGSADIMSLGAVTTATDVDPLNNGLGRNIRVDTTRLQVSNRQILDMQRQIVQATSIPPLLMLVNPSEFSRHYEHNLDYAKVRRGNQVHMWFEKPLAISCRGVTAGQYTMDQTGAGGLTTFNRVHSLSYKNLLSLVSIYRNNGYLYSGEGSGKGNDGIPILPMAVFIYYDNHVYIGSFSNFTVSDEASKSYNMSYDFKFNVRYDFDCSRMSSGEISSSISGST